MKSWLPRARCNCFSTKEQVGLASFLSFVILVFVSIDAYLLLVSAKPFSKRKTSIFLVLSNIGVILYSVQDFFYIFFGYFEDDSFQWEDLFYFIGFPLIFTPILVRSWRIICMYRSTIDLPSLRWNDLLERRKRGMQWLMTRIVVLNAPFFLACPFIFLNAKWTDFVVLPLQLMLILANLICSFVHFRLRKQLRVQHLDESVLLLVFSAILILFFIFDNLIYYMFVVHDQMLRLNVGLHLLVFPILLTVTSIPSLVYIVQQHRIERIQRAREERREAERNQADEADHDEERKFREFVKQQENEHFAKLRQAYSPQYYQSTLGAHFSNDGGFTGTGCTN